MKILMVNAVCGIKSTGRICTDIAHELIKQGHEVKIAYGREQIPEQFANIAYKIGNDYDAIIHGVKARLLDAAGYGSLRGTRRFIQFIKSYDPDVIHLHNLHGYYINIRELFDYLNDSGKRIIWTMHDCWAFTGHCAYFEEANCRKWEEGCFSCPQKKKYPSSITDFSKRNYRLKKELFEQLKALEIAVPSKWLEEYIKRSFFQDKKVTVIYNGINTDVFYKRDTDIHERYGLSGKKIILGVAAIWNDRKGLNDFIQLSHILDKDFVIMLIGLSKEQMNALPGNIIGIKRTNSSEELSEYYSAAFCYFNPTYEDNYPTTNIEAIACDTPVITYDTGGSGESAIHYGCVVEKGNIRAAYEAMKVRYKRDEAFDVSAHHFVEQYIKLYEV